MTRGRNPSKHIRRVIFVVAACAALGGGLAAQPAGAASLRHAGVSSYGASISSIGNCGGTSYGFRIYSSGFEWVRISTYRNGVLSVGTWARVPQVYSVFLPLPIATPGIYYLVEGYDVTPSGGEIVTVTTWFWRAPDLTYGTWFC